MIAAPLHAGTAKNGKFAWNEGAKIALDEFKKKLCARPLLMYPVFQKPFIVETDVSDRSFGAVLSQNMKTEG